MAGWLYDFQTLITGMVAAIAAIATVVVLRKQIRQASSDAAKMIEANQRNVDMQIAHEREIREAERRADRAREIDSIATILENEGRDLRTSIVGVPMCLDQIEQVHLQGAIDLREANAILLTEAIARFRDQLGKAEQTIKPLSIRYTRAAREHLTMLSVHASLLGFDQEELAKYGDNFQEKLEQARAKVEAIRADIAALKPSME